MAFRFTVVVRHNGHDIDRKSVDLRSKRNLFEALKKKFPDMDLIIDKKYGVEVSSISGLKKSKKAGLHFTIEGEVPWVTDPDTGKKLYLSLYHITATPEMLSGKRIVLELVSASCDFAGSVVDARLDFTTERFNLEPLLDLNASSRYLSKRLLPAYSERLWKEDHLHFLFHLERLSRRMGGFPVRKPREPVPNTIRLKPGNPKQEPSQRLPVEQSDFQINPISIEFTSAASNEGKTADAPVEAPRAQSSFFTSMVLAEGAAINQSSINPRPEADVEQPVRKHSIESNHKQKGSLPPKMEVKCHKTTAAVPLSSLTSFKAVIFDLDGIVVDSERVHLLTFNQVLRPYGIKISSSFWKRNYTGIGSVAIMKDVVARHNLKAGVQALVEKRSRIYGAYVQKHGLPEIIGFSEISTLLSENGVKIAVASGGHRVHIAASLRFLKMEGTPFAGLEDVQHAKPAPDTFLLAAEKLGVKPSECMVFEDSLAGIEAARRAIMPCIALSTTLPAKLLEGKAAAVFRNYRSRKLKRLLLELISKKGVKKREREETKKNGKWQVAKGRAKARTRRSSKHALRFHK